MPIDISPSEFDASKWARSFVSYVAESPGIAADESTMLTWFASAIMAGHDHGRRVESEHMAILQNELITYAQCGATRLQQLVDLFGQMVQDKSGDPATRMQRIDALADIIKNQIQELQTIATPTR